MALATKCPHCNTIFRVAHDQLKLRGGIVRCGACNEVFDGNAALVEPALKQPVIIDLPAAPLAAPTTSPELEALITTLDARHSGAPEAEPVPAAEAFDLILDVELDEEPDPQAAPAGGPQHRPLPWEDAAAPTAAIDIELPGNMAAAPDALSIGDQPVAAAEHMGLAPAPEQDHGPDGAPAPEDGPEPEFGLASGPANDAEPARPAYPPLSALDDEDRPALPPYGDGRREPTLDLPDEHLTAVALHDSFELDAYPRKDGAGLDDDEDDDVVTLSRAATGARAPAGDGRGADDGGDESGGRDGRVRDGGSSDGGSDGGSGADAATGPATPLSAGLGDDEPGFVKRDRRRQQLGKAARVGMALGIPLLLAALAAQVLGTFRNPLAAAVPALKPALVSACALAGCKVELPAQIDALSIEQGELQTLAENVFSFSTTLRNGSRSAQAWPHIELILNDDANKPVLRRVFAPREYLANPADAAKGFGPRSEQSVKLHFQLAQVKASGYHIAVFYP